MQLTFILGNGFDRAIGLKTGYKDFYNWYIQQPDESDDVALMKEEINKYLKDEDSTWADFEIALGKFTNVITDKERFIKVFECARLALIRYLTEEYKVQRAENEDFLLSAAYCLIDLSKKYAGDFPEERKAYFSVAQDTGTTFNCITFNYTTVLRDGYEEIQGSARSLSSHEDRWGRYKLGKMLNVHGQLDDFPILGVDNPEQIANENFRDDPDILQLMVKGEIDKKLGKNWRAEAQNIIDDSDIIYVYGASLGETDAFWWKTLAKWYEDDIDNRQLALYCHPDDDEDKLRMKQETFVKNVSKYFVHSDYEASIVVDSVIKKMTVKFVHMSAHTQITTMCTAKPTVIPASELEDDLEGD